MLRSLLIESGWIEASSLDRWVKYRADLRRYCRRGGRDLLSMLLVMRSARA